MFRFRAIILLSVLIRSVRSSINTPPIPQYFWNLSHVSVTGYIFRYVEVWYFQTVYISCMFLISYYFYNSHWYLMEIRSLQKYTTPPAHFWRFYMSHFPCYYYIIIYFIFPHDFFHEPVYFFALISFFLFSFFDIRALVPLILSITTCFGNIWFSQPCYQCSTDFK